MNDKIIEQAQAVDPNGSVRVDLGDGRTTSLRWDDQETGHGISQKPKLTVADKIDDRVHGMPENWLRTRMRGWMDTQESPDLDWWICTYTADGRLICASSNQDTYIPLQHKIDYARNVCRYINKEVSHGGAWFTGWMMGGHQFVMLWKDPDGDIQLSLPCDRPFTAIVGWTMEIWANHCQTAWETWCEWQDTLELRAAQQVKIGQGQQIDVDKHLAEAPPVGI